MPDPTHEQGMTWRRRLWLLVCLFMSGGLWGLTPSLAKLATSQGAHPLGLTLYQAIGGGLLVLVISLVRKRPVLLSRAHLSFYLICGLVGTAIPTALLFAAAPNLPAGIMAILITTVPLMTYVIALAFEIDTPSPIRLLGIALGFSAVLLIALPERDADTTLPVVWVMLTLCMPVCYSIESIVIAMRRPPDGDEISLLAGMLLTSGLLLAPLVYYSDTAVALSAPWGTTEWATFGILVINVLSYGFFLHLVKISGPVFATQAGYWSMIFGVLWGTLLWNESHPPWTWVALILMLAGMSLVKERAVPLGS